MLKKLVVWMSNKSKISGIGKLAFAMAAILALAGLSFADISVSSYVVSPTTVKPGSSGLVTLTVSNNGAVTVDGIKLTALGSGPLKSNTEVYVGDISPGGSTIISIPFSVLPSAAPGIYNFQAQLYGSSFVSTLYSSSRDITQKSFTIPVSVVDPPIFQVSSKSSTVYTDGTFTLEGTLKNSGGSVKDVRLYVGQSSDPRTSSVLGMGSGFVAMSLPLYLGSVENSSDFSTEVMVASNVSSGVYSLPIGIIYDDDLGNTNFDRAAVLLNVVRKSPDFLVSIAENSPTPGQMTKLKVTVENSGDKPAYSMRVSLGTNTVLTPLGSSIGKVGNVDIGESKEITFDVGVSNIQPGFYSIPFTIQYQNSKGEEQAPVSQNAGLNVVVNSDVDFFASGKPSPIVAGQQNTIEIQTSNVGSAPLSALKVSFDSDAFSLIDAQNSQFIGSLNPDDFSTLQFKVKTKDVPDGKQPVTLTAVFRDSYNSEHTVKKTVYLDVVSQATAAQDAAVSGGGSGTIAIGIAVVAVLAVGLWYFKFRKKPSKQAQHVD
ncbi:MAG: CARDB domain-containing protein [Candidatus Micrarchaeia archaeon]